MTIRSSSRPRTPRAHRSAARPSATGPISAMRFSARACGPAGFSARFRQRPRSDPGLGTDGPGAAVKSASAFRAGCGRQARAILSIRAGRRPHSAAHATRLTRPQAFSDSHKPRSSRKRSTGAAEWMARMRVSRTPVHWNAHFSSTRRDAGLLTRAPGLQSLVPKVAERVIDHGARGFCHRPRPQ